MDNPTRWNITNSAQNIVSALVDPSKQFDGVFRREWSNTFANFSRPSAQRQTSCKKLDNELKTKLNEYLKNLARRNHIKSYEAQRAEKSQEIENAFQEQQNTVVVPEIFFKEDFDLSDLDTFNKVTTSIKFSGGAGKSSIKNLNDNDGEEQLFISNYRNQHLLRHTNTNTKLLTKAQLKELQQCFTDYLDIIEDRLASQISNRSGDFFQVMSSVDSVMDELSLAIKSVTTLRKKCSKLNETMIAPNMKIIQLNRNRDNAQIVLDKMNEIAYLYKVQPKLLGTDFTNLSELVESIANGFSEISERNSLTLSSLLQIQAEKFVNKFHEERKRRLEAILDVEKWKTIDDVPVDFQRMITMLIDDERTISETLPSNHHQLNRISKQLDSSPVVSKLSGTNQASGHSRAPSDAAASIVSDSNGLNRLVKDEDDLSQSKDQTQDQLVSGKIQRISSAPTTISSSLVISTPVTINASILTSTGKVGYLVAAGSTYVVVNSVINLIRTLMDYCKCAYDIRSLSADLLERLFKILQLYNSKTYHLVYSAGAVQVAGLKNITTRSLVVSQRSLKLIILLIPAIYKHFSQLLPDSNRLRRFDEIKLSYEDHAAKIPERVNSIVKDVINLQLREWEAKPPVPSLQFNAITQHLTRLHDNIEDALPADELKFLFLRISETFKEILIQHLRRLNINNDAGPQQWLVTQELTFYRISLNKLSAFKGWELNFDDLWTKLDEGTPMTQAASRLSPPLTNNSATTTTIAPSQSIESPHVTGNSSSNNRKN